MLVLHRFIRPRIGLARYSIGRRIARRNLGISAFKPLTRHSIEAGYASESRGLVWRVLRQPPRRMPTFSMVRAARKEKPRDVSESEVSETILAMTEFESAPGFNRDELVDATRSENETPWTRANAEPNVETRKPSRPIQIQAKVEELTRKADAPTPPERAPIVSSEKTPTPEEDTFELPAAPVIPADEQISQPTMVEPESEPSAVAPSSQPSAIETTVALPQRSAISPPHVESNVIARDVDVGSPARSTPPARSDTNVDVTSPKIKHAQTPPTPDSSHPSPTISAMPPMEKPVNQRDNVMQQSGLEETCLVTRRLAPHVRLPVARQILPAKQISRIAARESIAPAARISNLVRQPGLPEKTEHIQRDEAGKPLTLVRPITFLRQTRFDQNAPTETAEQFDQDASAEIAENETRATLEPTSQIARMRDVAGSSPSSPTLLRREEQSDAVPARIQRESPRVSARTRRSVRKSEREEQVSSIQEESFIEKSLVEDKHLAAPLAFDATSIQREPIEAESATPTPTSREAPSPTTGTSPATSAKTPEGAPGVDLDTMARQVYQILRRRLHVELERSRGWSG